jgi:hypothetical protein
MSRAPLPNRRQSRSFPFEHRKIKYHGSWSYFGDQRRPDLRRPAEVFLEGGKIGSDIQAISRDAAVAVSLAFQFGVPLSTMRDALTRNDDGSPAGPMGVLLDHIAKEAEEGQNG